MLNLFSLSPFFVTPNKKWSLKGKGIEIGAHNKPVPNITPVYVDRFWHFAGESCLVDVISDAVRLPFKPVSLDYIAASHLIEHLPNPVQAIFQWFYLLKRGGILYIVIPDARYTFDHRRERTTLEHLVEDYKQNCNECDSTHIDEFTENVDISMLNLGLDASDIERMQVGCNLHFHDQVASGKGINIHFHVFDPENFLTMINYTVSDLGLDWSVVELTEKFPQDRGDGFLVVLKKKG